MTPSYTYICLSDSNGQYQYNKIIKKGQLCLVWLFKKMHGANLIFKH